MIYRLQLIHKLVAAQRTGTPEEFARQLGIKKRMLYDMIDELKARDLPISYSRTNKTFYYTTPVNFQLDYKIEVLDEQELENRNAGCSIYFSPCIFIARSSSIFKSIIKSCKYS